MKVTIDSLFSDKKKVDAYTYRGGFNDGSIVHYCIENNKLDLLKEVINNENKINHLIDEKIIDVVDCHGIAPIHLAVFEKKRDFINLLIEQKCKQVADLEGKSLFHYALLSNYKDILFEPKSPYILGTIKKDRVLIFVTNTLITKDVIKINKIVSDHRINLVKIYLNKSKTTKDFACPASFTNDAHSVAQDFKFICYLGENNDR